VADLMGGHNGRIFCIGFDCKKVRAPFYTRFQLHCTQTTFVPCFADSVMR